MAFPTSQELRHQANYDPIVRFKQGVALSAADYAEPALTSLEATPRDEQLFHHPRPRHDTKLMGHTSFPQQRPLLLLSSRPWNGALANRLSRSLDRPVESITAPAHLTPAAVAAIDPQWIFVPHWSHLIPESVWGPWPTVIFHMTDLPYGQGGSPLQNLIQRGHSSTMLTALRCGSGLDTGDVYLKQPLSLHGSAEEIFLRADILIEQMIERIVCEEPMATPQQGEPVLFTRRKAAQSNLASCPEGDLIAWYDQIRMLDAEGYPHAFLEIHGMRLELRRVCQRSDGLHADVRIIPIASPPLPMAEDAGQ